MQLVFASHTFSLVASLVSNRVVGAARVGSGIWQLDSCDTLDDM